MYAKMRSKRRQHTISKDGSKESQCQMKLNTLCKIMTFRDNTVYFFFFSMGEAEVVFIFLWLEREDTEILEVSF